MSASTLTVATSGYNQTFNASVVTPPSNGQIRLSQAAVQNGSGSALNAAIARKFANPTTTTGPFNVYQLIAANTPDANDVTLAICGGTNTNIFTTTNNDGFMIQSARKFNLVSIAVTTAQAGSPVYEYTYWNGSTWSVLSTIAVPASYTVGNMVIAFHAPIDWVAGSDAAVGGALTGAYSLRVRATTAGSQAVVANAVVVGQFMAYQKSLADGATLSFPQGAPTIASAVGVVFDSGESVAAYFGTANAANNVSVVYETV